MRCNLRGRESSWLLASRLGLKCMEDMRLLASRLGLKCMEDMGLAGDAVCTRLEAGRRRYWYWAGDW